MFGRRGMGRGGRPGLLGTVARTAVVAGTATVVSGGISRHQQAKAQQKQDAQAYEQEQAAPEQAPPEAAPQQYAPAPQQYAPAPQQYAPAPPQYAPAPPQYAPAPPQAESTDDLIEQLEKLGKLRDGGVLTEEEFTAQKTKLLNA